jgi:hypothetical protein
VNALPFLSKIQCPAPRRALSFGLLIAVAILSGCGYFPRAVEGVPPGEPWVALPLRKWLAEGRAEPQAMAFCAPPECTPGLAVGVVRLTGEDAETAEAVLKQPERLAQALRSPVGRAKPVKTIVSVRQLEDGPRHGFAISLAPASGRKLPAYGAALGQRFGSDLHLVLVVGDDERTVEVTARRVAIGELGS